MPHLIRLRGPWTFELTWEGRLQNGEVEFPAAWSSFIPSDFFGPVTLLRRFGRPTGLTPGVAVSLTIIDGPMQGIVRLNGVQLGEINALSPTSRWEVAASLLPRNELRIELKNPPPFFMPSVTPDVRLEIDAPDLA